MQSPPAHDEQPEHQARELYNPTLNIYWDRVAKACQIGDIASLRSLLKEPHAPELGPEIPRTDDMKVNFNLLLPAINYQQPEVVKFIFLTWPHLPICWDTVVNAATGENSCLPVFKALYAHDREIGTYETDTLKTTLSLLCTHGDAAAAEFLLDQNVADPNRGTVGGSPLLQAVLNGQPISLVKKLLQKGAVLDDSIISVAIRARKHQHLEYLLTRARLKDAEELLYRANEEGDKTSIRLMQEYIDRRNSKRKSISWRFGLFLRSLFGR